MRLASCRRTCGLDVDAGPARRSRPRLLTSAPALNNDSRSATLTTRFRRAHSENHLTPRPPPLCARHVSTRSVDTAQTPFSHPHFLLDEPLVPQRRRNRCSSGAYGCVPSARLDQGASSLSLPTMSSSSPTPLPTSRTRANPPPTGTLVHLRPSGPPCSLPARHRHAP
mgnify:FL=1